jgi:hypothetical protein
LPVGAGSPQGTDTVLRAGERVTGDG